METMQSRRQLLPIMAVWMPAVTASAAGPADAVVSLSALGVNPCIEPATSGCVFGTAEPAQETTSTSPQPPPYRLIRANGSEHIYFQTIGEPRKHLVRKGLCHICGRPEVCGAVVEVDASYVDGLESETDFDCDMLDAVGVRRNTSAAGGAPGGPPGRPRPPLLWAAAAAIALSWLFCCTMWSCALRKRFAARPRRKRAVRDGLEELEAYSPVPPLHGPCPAPMTAQVGPAPFLMVPGTTAPPLAPPDNWPVIPTMRGGVPTTKSWPSPA
uniref:Uncharacterized protein n=1 Tax=Alexandrium monilatum TaxID=311494 RepID=A0A7S4V2P4_9DINO|mmetsp:Transcript_22052/g.69058  ORF Transcript_22052/g.69058 Transcript_22052/m.69058 type:complete len:270 (+) Transcript_22052:53-862(+)